MLQGQETSLTIDTVAVKVIDSFDITIGKKTQRINLVEAKAQGGYGSSLLLVTNNLFDIKNKKNIKTLFVVKRGNFRPDIQGVLYVISLDMHPAPALRSSMAGIPVLLSIM